MKNKKDLKIAITVVGSAFALMIGMLGYGIYNKYSTGGVADDEYIAEIHRKIDATMADDVKRDPSITGDTSMNAATVSSILTRCQNSLNAIDREISTKNPDKELIAKKAEEAIDELEENRSEIDRRLTGSEYESFISSLHTAYNIYSEAFYRALRFANEGDNNFDNNRTYYALSRDRVVELVNDIKEQLKDIR